MKKKLAFTFMLCFVMLALSGCKCEHEWKDADCTTPKICTKCGETEGEALGHTWVEATCEKEKHCSVCGATEGELLDHTWVEATCEEPKHCKICGAAEGTALGHDWTTATCSAAKTCTRCGKTDGEPLAHTPGEQELTADYVNAVYTVQSVCTICGEPVEKQEIDMSTLQDNGKFLFNAKEFTERFTRYLKDQLPSYSAILSLPPNESMGVVINHFDDWVASLLFTDEKKFMQSGREEDRDISVMIIKFESTDSSDLASVLLALTQTCDPSLSYSDAQNVCSSIVICGQKALIYEHNGIKYLLGQKNGEFEFYISLLNK